MRTRLPIFALLTLASAGPVVAQNLGAFIESRVPKAPTAVMGDGKVQLIYELRITNYGPDRALTQIEVLGNGAGAPLLTIPGEDLKKVIRLIGPQPGAAADARVVPVGRSATLFLQVTLADAKSVPTSLRHRVVSALADSVAQSRRDTTLTAGVSVLQPGPMVIASPFGGGGGAWVAVNGPGNTSGHRRTLIPIGGLARIPQRFGTDWIKLGPEGAPFHGDSTVNANWYGYGTPIVAVAHGKVVEVKDGIIENVPLSPKMAVPITLETVGGNHVILEIGPGVYAFYAHLQPGSLKVKLGDFVSRGAPIGLLGNSGNSTAPHLHMHVGDQGSPLGCEGIPFVFDQFQLLGRVKGVDQEEVWKATQPAVSKSRELPMENQVVLFPK
ncbi:MAG: M23 family metallopeptidase [Gemmatimonadota bacterium]